MRFITSFLTLCFLVIIVCTGSTIIGMGKSKSRSFSFDKNTIAYVSHQQVTSDLQEVNNKKGFTIQEVAVEDKRNSYLQLALQAYKEGRPEEHEKYFYKIPEEQKVEAWYTLAVAYCKPDTGKSEEKKWDIVKAKVFLKEAIKKNHREARYKLGKLYYKENNTTLAGEYLNTYLNLHEKDEEDNKTNNNENATTKKRLGNTFYMLGKIYETLVKECYERARNYGNTDALLALGKVHEGEEEFEKAANYYQQAEEAYQAQLTTSTASTNQAASSPQLIRVKESIKRNMSSRR